MSNSISCIRLVFPFLRPDHGEDGRCEELSLVTPIPLVTVTSSTPPPPHLNLHLHLAEAEDSSMSTESLSSSLPAVATIWASPLLSMLQTVVVPFTFCFRPATIALAAFWLIYRAYHVLHIPLDDLASLLGFDIPLTPIIDLASVKADGCIVHWSLPEKLRQKQKSKLKWEVHLNGVVVESVATQESAVTITGLQPSSFYVVRVALVNEQEFGSRSEPIRFRTRAAVSGDCFVVPPDGHETDHDGSAETLPRVRVYRGLRDITPASIEATPMGREHSNSGLGPKRSITGRRPSPAALGLDGRTDIQVEEGEPPEGLETIQQLTERLDVLRYETDETERQARDEEEEESRMKEELAEERDALRAEAAEKEKATRNLKREVNVLERQNTAAQNERSKHERLLLQKKQEREKLKQDMVRWEREAEGMQQEAEQIRSSRSEHLQQFEREKVALRSSQAGEATAMRSLEDEVKETNTSIKKIERAIKNSSPDHVNGAEEPNLVQQMQQEAEQERQWQLHRANLTQQYTAVYQKLEAAKRFYSEQIRYLESVRAQRRRDDDFAAAQQQFSSPPAPADRAIRRGDSQRSRRAPSGHSTSDSPHIGGGFPMVPTNSTQGSFPPGLNTISGPGTTSFPFMAPFFNVHNGMTLRTNGLPPVDGEHGLTDEERERFTGGAPMSPGAGAELLPADLFLGDELASAGGRQQLEREQRVMPLPGLGTVPPPPPGLPMPAATAGGAERGEYFMSGFNGPASLHNLHLGSPHETFAMMDADRRSIRSTRSGRAATGGAGGGGAASAAGSRFSSMFGIKARTKALAGGGGGAGMVAGEEGLALGKAHSHSMPRQDQGLPGLDLSGQRKRNSSISGVFGDLGASHDGASDVATPGSSQVSRRRAFGMGSIFSRDKDGFGGGWPSSFTAFGRRPGSPRPGSTHSNELPRPSMDSSRWGVDTWPSASAAGGAGPGDAPGARSSPLSLTAGWSVPSTQAGGGLSGVGRLWGSRHPSRRPSVQYGNSSGGPPEDIMEDEGSEDEEDGGDETRGKPRMAPIGTRPSGKKAVVPVEDEEEDDGDEQQGTTTPSASSPSGLIPPRLNPAAKDFKSFFGLKSSKDKDKPRTGSPGAGASSTLTQDPHHHHDDSPPDSRKSRSDARSLTTTESSLTAESSGEMNGGELARTPSYANSDATGGGGAALVGSNSGGGSVGKESFMQKISRKSSSSKFSLPTFKREKSRLDTLNVTGMGFVGTPDTMAEEDGGSGEVLAASVGSVKEAGRGSKEGNRGSGRGWSQVLKLGGGGSRRGKGGGETPSLSGLSLASGDREEGGSGDEE
ncbi:hypothetical protein LTR91_012226 [Friedmanniomyces endolithicus]|uniref:Fibronectin type-III domain-containing protein n=1 Tax=Friedmanniomyces endolithicus TaxID=329885 RepID=A0AAN6KFW8_9PEZI|nr:hypothetical protein LTR75_005603 [Friedmanniomyces endolithicus]KAK0876072.1 hypothetical protein LTR87_010124 [Friedmanniomyces endolithicus]KAK0919650.1 hypothetical protein LTR57_010455 [Friedmanniomyces endolithicus]KAK0973649.1 hypothetical protein LTS01_014509 [Friedmanniomyces endolithicus]KAK0980579.1 hypothetical protein LTR91_012226 [Friedmanniomyces endolithicus]